MRIYEKFESPIMRTLANINSKEHIDIDGKVEMPLSKSGIVFLTHMPIEWNRLTDENFRIFADADIVDSIPQTTVDNIDVRATDIQKKKDSKGRTLRHNLGATVSTLTDRYSEEYRLAELTSELTSLGKKFKNAKKRSRLIGKDDDYIRFDTMLSELNNLWGNETSLIRYYRDQQFDNTSLRNILKKIDDVGDIEKYQKHLSPSSYETLKSIFDYYNAAIKKYNDEYSDWVSKQASERGEAPKVMLPHVMKTKYRHMADNFSKYDQLENSIYPYFYEFVGTSDNYMDSILYNDDELKELFSNFGDKFSYDDIYNDVIVGISNDATNHVMSGRDMNVTKQRILINFGKFMRKYMYNDEDRSSYNKTLNDILKKYKNGRIDDDAVSNKKMYDLYYNLYRHAVTPTENTKSQNVRIINNIKDYIFDIDGNDVFNIVILGDAKFKIKYVLSYFIPSTTTFMLMKSKNDSVLYGWKSGDSVSSVIRNMKTLYKDSVLLPKQYMTDNVSEYDSYTSIDIDEIKRDKDITTAIIISGGRDVTNEGKTIGEKRTLRGDYSSMRKKDNIFSISGNDDKINIGSGDNGSALFDKKYVKKFLDKNSILYNIEGDKIVIDTKDVDNDYNKLRTLFGDMGINYDVIVDKLDHINVYKELYQAFKLPSSINTEKSLSEFVKLYREFLKNDFDMDEKTVDNITKNSLPHVYKFVDIKSGDLLGYSSLFDGGGFLYDGMIECVDGKFYGKEAFEKMEELGYSYGGPIIPISNGGIKLLSVADTGVVDTISYDTDVFINYLNSEASGELHKVFMNMCDTFDCGYGTVNKNKVGGKLYKQQPNKLLKTLCIYTSEYTKYQIVDEMVKAMEITTVYHDVINSVRECIKELNDYITPRYPFIEFGSDVGKNTDTLEQHFNTVSAKRAVRSGVYSDNTVKRVKDAEEESKNIRELNKEYRKAFNEMTDGFKSEFKIKVQGQTIKQYMNALEDKIYDYELPFTFNGYNFFNGQNGGPGKYESVILGLLSDVHSKLTFGEYTSDKVPDIYDEFGGFLNDIVKVSKDLSNIKKDNDQDKNVAEQIKKLYTLYYDLVDILNSEYNLNVKKVI